MRAGTISRFHLATAATVALGVVVPQWWLVVAAYVALVALGVTFPQMQFFGTSLCRGPTTERVVALTFDDGPDPAVTPDLLELLKKHGVPATFFVVGQRVEDHPALARQVSEAGHLLANHSFAHSHFSNFFTTGRLRGEIGRTQAAVTRHTGQQPRFYRPPVGLTNPRVFRAASALGLTVVGWTMRGFDKGQRDPAAIVNRIVRRLQPGAIIVLHDGGVPGSLLLPAVEELLVKLQQLGYRAERLDRLMEMK
jgi:peptidoglycan/xylan/chitin deacetylase (PgdA/CDA1 family)